MSNADLERVWDEIGNLDGYPVSHQMKSLDRIALDVQLVDLEQVGERTGAGVLRLFGEAVPAAGGCKAIDALVRGIVEDGMVLDLDESMHAQAGEFTDDEIQLLCETDR